MAGFAQGKEWWAVAAAGCPSIYYTGLQRHSVPVAQNDAPTPSFSAAWCPLRRFVLGFIRSTMHTAPETAIREITVSITPTHAPVPTTAIPL